MMELVARGGIILVLIMGLSVVGLVIIVERLIFFNRNRVDETKLLARLKDVLGKKQFEEALQICETHQSPFTNLMKVGIQHRDKSQDSVKAAILEAAALEIPQLERGLSFLGTIGHIAPLLGLLGTVTGNIAAFGVLSNMQNVGDPSLLAQGIAEALVTTAGGIIVAIPAVAFYNYLTSRVNHSIIRLENRVNELVYLFVDSAGGPLRSQPVRPQPVPAADRATTPGLSDWESAPAPVAVPRGSSPATPAVTTGAPSPSPTPSPSAAPSRAPLDPRPAGEARPVREVRPTGDPRPRIAAGAQRPIARPAGTVGRSTPAPGGG